MEALSDTEELNGMVTTKVYATFKCDHSDHWLTDHLRRSPATTLTSVLLILTCPHVDMHIRHIIESPRLDTPFYVTLSNRPSARAIEVFLLYFNYGVNPVFSILIL